MFICSSVTAVNKKGVCPLQAHALAILTLMLFRLLYSAYLFHLFEFLGMNTSEIFQCLMTDIEQRSLSVLKYKMEGKMSMEKIPLLIQIQERL